jgi:hypothetical protein
MGPSINLGFATRDFCKRPCGSAGPLAKKQGSEVEEVLKRHGPFSRSRRRSQRHLLPWRRFAQIAARWLPKPGIPPPYPNERFDAKHPK